VSKPALFLRNSGYRGLAAMGSGLVSLILLLVGVHGPITPTHIFVLTAVLFAWGAYAAWAKQHDKLIEEIERNPKPELRCEIVAGYINPRVTHESSGHVAVGMRDCFIVLALRLRNLRQVPTTVRVESMKVRGNWEEGEAKFIERITGLYFDKEVAPHQISRMQRPSIDLEITDINPLSYGKERECWALFWVDDFPLDDYSRTHVHLVLSDGLGIKSSFDAVIPLQLAKMKGM